MALARPAQKSCVNTQSSCNTVSLQLQLPGHLRTRTNLFNNDKDCYSQTCFTNSASHIKYRSTLRVYKYFPQLIPLDTCSRPQGMLPLTRFKGGPSSSEPTFICVAPLPPWRLPQQCFILTYLSSLTRCWSSNAQGPLPIFSSDGWSFNLRRHFVAMKRYLKIK